MFTIQPLALRCAVAAVFAITAKTPAVLANTIPGHGCFRSMGGVQTRMNELVDISPELASVTKIGDSFLHGKDTSDLDVNPNGYDFNNHDTGIYAMTVTAFDSPHPSETKGKMLIITGVHPRELSPPELAMRFAELLIEGYDQDPDTTWLLERTEIHFIFYVNPDGRFVVENGFMKNWRKNLNPGNKTCPEEQFENEPFLPIGVDINRNFPFQHGEGGSSNDACLNTYHGPSGGSEPETQAVMNYVRQIFPNDQREETNPSDKLLGDLDSLGDNIMGIFVDIHSRGDFIFYPGSFSGTAADDEALEAMARKIHHFNEYTFWKENECSVHDATLCTYEAQGDTVDYAYGVQGVASFGLELGNAFAQDCVFFEQNVVEKNIDALFYAAKTATLPFSLIKGPDILNLTVMSAGSDINVQGEASDSLFVDKKSPGYVTGNQGVVEVALYLDVHPSDYVFGDLVWEMDLQSSADPNRIMFEETITLPTGLRNGRHTLYAQAKDGEGYLGPVTSRFFVSEKKDVDVMMVLDRSGSMLDPDDPSCDVDTTSCLRKIDVLQESANLFVDLLRSDESHGLGLVSFSTTSSLDSELESFNSDKEDEIKGLIGDLSPGGSTSIGGGLSSAQNEFDRVASSSDNNPSILLMTDGLQNSDPMVEDVVGDLEDTSVCAIGYGSDANLDGAVLGQLASDTGGLYTRAGNDLELKEFFVNCFGEIFNDNTMPGGEGSPRRRTQSDPSQSSRSCIPTGDRDEWESSKVTFDVCDETELTIVAAFNKPNYRVSLKLISPSGREVSPSSQGVVSESGSTYRILRVPLPFEGESAGAWKALIYQRREIIGRRRAQSQSENCFFISALATGGHELIRQGRQGGRYYTGDTIIPIVSLVSATNNIIGPASGDIFVTRPTVGSGNILAESLESIGSTAEGDINPRQAALRLVESELDNYAVEQFDLNAQDPNDPLRPILPGLVLYNELDIADFEGEYTFRAVVDYGREIGCPSQRELTWTVHVDVGIDPAETLVDLIFGTPSPDGFVPVKIVFIPKDRFGNSLGPGRLDAFDIELLSGTIRDGPLVDNLDGSYSVDVIYDPAVSTIPGLIINQPEREGVIPRGRVGQWFIKDWSTELCAQDCEPAGDGACVGPANTWDILYDSAFECCQRRLSWKHLGWCTANSRGNEYLGSGQYYVDYGRKKCMKDCTPGSSLDDKNECGMIIEDSWVRLYDEVEECCKQELGWLDADTCANPSGTSTATQGKFYVDYTGYKCGKHCDPVNGLPCMGAPPDSSGIPSAIYDTEEECCAQKLFWIDLGTCVANTNGVPLEAEGSTDWYVDWNRNFGTCVQDCLVGDGPSCGGLRENWEPRHANAEDCCASIPWQPESVCHI